MNSRIKTPRKVRVSGGQRFGTIKLNDRVKAEAERIAAENRLFNAGLPRCEHRTTSVRKLRKRLRKVVRVVQSK